MTAACAAGPRCVRYNRALRTGAPVVALAICEHCEDAAELAMGKLGLDYDGLAEILGEQHTSGGEIVSGSRERPILIDAGVDALMAEIVHATVTWWWALTELRGVAGPPVPPATQPRARLAAALGVLRPHARDLAGLGRVLVHPTGVEDPLAEMEGWQGLLHLAHLHDRAATMLGLTDHTTSLYGECPDCHRPTITTGAGAEITALAVRDGDETVYCRARGCTYKAGRDQYRRDVGGGLAVGAHTTTRGPA